MLQNLATWFACLAAVTIAMGDAKGETNLAPSRYEIHWDEQYWNSKKIDLYLSAGKMKAGVTVLTRAQGKSQQFTMERNAHNSSFFALRAYPESSEKKYLSLLGKPNNPKADHNGAFSFALVLDPPNFRSEIWNNVHWEEWALEGNGRLLFRDSKRGTFGPYERGYLDMVGAYRPSFLNDLIAIDENQVDIYYSSEPAREDYRQVNPQIYSDLRLRRV